MKCPTCSVENREGATYCKKCGANLNLPAPWTPTWRWHLKTLLTIYAVLILFYLTVNAVLARLPEPYRPRQIPQELTPWLK